eukprot:1153929-Pelagomonas_calceolata.AAC.2
MLGAPWARAGASPEAACARDNVKKAPTLALRRKTLSPTRLNASSPELPHAPVHTHPWAVGIGFSAAEARKEYRREEGRTRAGTAGANY